MTLTQTRFRFRFTLIRSWLAVGAVIGCSHDAHRLGGEEAAGADGDGQTGGHATTTTGAGGDGGADTPSTLAGSGGANSSGGESGSVEPLAIQGDTCPILFPTAPTYYPGDANSPCPKQAIQITDPDRTCDKSLLGTRCVYPSSVSSDAQDVWTCELVGGLNGEDTPDAFGEWAQGLALCTRTGLDCRAEDAEAITLPDSGLCESSPSTCEVDFDVTAQDVLDRMMSTLVADCMTSTLDDCTTASLSVRFEAGCAVDFVVDPRELAPCVQTALETLTYRRPACASNLACSYAEVGGCLL